MVRRTGSSSEPIGLAVNVTDFADEQVDRADLEEEWEELEDVGSKLDPVHVSSTRPLESGVRRVHSCHTLTGRNPVL